MKTIFDITVGDIATEAQEFLGGLYPFDVTSAYHLSAEQAGNVAADVLSALTADGVIDRPVNAEHQDFELGVIEAVVKSIHCDYMSVLRQEELSAADALMGDARP